MAFCRRIGVLAFDSVVMKTSRFSVIRPVSTSGKNFAAIDTEFSAAKERLTTLKEDPGNEIKLKLYALFKQATVGKCNAKKPSTFDFVGKAKWTAWNSLGVLSQEDAQKQYISTVNDLVAVEESASEEVASGTAGDYKQIKVTVEDGVCTILLNRPAKKNAINLEMYNEIGVALNEIGKDPKVVLAVVTGAGDYYCSGNDLENFMNIDPSKIHEFAKEGADVLRQFVASFINFPKPLIGAINGPVVGVAVSTLSLFDVVYATDRATFHTPFTALGQSPEGCSSVLFPRIMGQGKVCPGF
ncbi:enoyl-CoA delta isomerase 2-like [Saccoglossus kowalevskii]|uniref:Enoyl-CoA delta isomerase 2, mitochondrial-like n=1 Tax=Saccoglossus kowalevskii TaxID=10224 RepID=A0ABM0H0T6_SACKO|nr:PREDICTED: enoyl-CoA delta isomerase 2, mitochondrial-like [Saccoglossus kowalevskii]